MKKTMTCIALLGVMLAANAELERVSLDGTWDFSFSPGAKLSAASSDFKATDKMVVPGCFDLMPKWYAQRGLAHYRRTFSLDKDAKDAWLVVKGMGLQAKFFIDGREAATSKLPYSTIEIPLGPLAAGEHVIVAALDNRLDGSKELIYKPNYDFFLSGGFYHGVELKLQHAEVELDRVVVRTRDYKTGLVELALEAKGTLTNLFADVFQDGPLPKPLSGWQAKEQPGVFGAKDGCLYICGVGRGGIAATFKDVQTGEYYAIRFQVKGNTGLTIVRFHRKGGAADLTFPHTTVLAPPTGDENGWREVVGLVRVPQDTDSMLVSIGVGQKPDETTLIRKAGIYRILKYGNPENAGR